MKILTPSVLALALLATACQLRPPDITAPGVPAAPLAEALEAQRRKLATVKAVARVETERRGRKRSYESVAIVIDGSRGRLRVEGFGPLGESLFALLWDGRAVLLRPPGEPEFAALGQAGLERVLGVALAPADLCAALAGNVILPGGDAPIRAGCETDGRCVIHVPGEREVRRLHVSRPAGGGEGLTVAGEDRYDGGTVVYRGRFEDRAVISGYSFPRTVTIENPDRQLRLVVRYEDVEVNAPVDEGIFEGGAR